MSYTITDKVITQRIYHFEFNCPDEVDVQVAFLAMPLCAEVQADIKDLIKQGYEMGMQFGNGIVNGIVNGIAKATVTFSKEEEA